MKRTFDIIFSIIALLVFAIPMIIIAILLLFKERHALFFKQQRIGILFCKRLLVKRYVQAKGRLPNVFIAKIFTFTSITTNIVRTSLPTYTKARLRRRSQNEAGGVLVLIGIISITLFVSSCKLPSKL